jgi:hypothetical protein
MSVPTTVGRRVAVTGLTFVLVAFGGFAQARLRASHGSLVGPCVAPIHTIAGLAALVRGDGLAAAVGGSIVTRSADGRSNSVGVLPGGLARHVASRAGVGIAYVSDRRGDDRVVVLGTSGSEVLAEDAEAMHPSWSADGRLVWSLGAELRIRSADGSRIRSIPAPPGAARVFSPIFVARSRLVAVVSEHVSGPHDDAAQDNLWTYDLVTDRWVRRTSFAARGRAWSAIRTPVPARAGVRFVRIRADASTTDRVSFELWSLMRGRADLIRRLPDERYLASMADGVPIWNRFDAVSGEWRLFAEKAQGTLRDLGCGRVQVDPRGQADPDLAPISGASSPATRGSTGAPGPTLTPGPTPPSIPAPSTTPDEPSPTPLGPTAPSMAVLVGDFSSLDAAVRVADRIREAYGEARGVAVVDNAQAPVAVAPGVWAVVLPVAGADDPVAALASFRARFPEFAGWSWMVAV